MKSNDESEGNHESRRPSTTSTAGTFDNTASDSSDRTYFSANEEASGRSSAVPVPDARSSGDGDGESSRYETGEEEEDDGQDAETTPPPSHHRDPSNGSASAPQTQRPFDPSPFEQFSENRLPAHTLHGQSMSQISELIILLFKWHLLENMTVPTLRRLLAETKMLEKIERPGIKMVLFQVAEDHPSEARDFSRRERRPSDTPSHGDTIPSRNHRSGSQDSYFWAPYNEASASRGARTSQPRNEAMNSTYRDEEIDDGYIAPPRRRSSSNPYRPRRQGRPMRSNSEYTGMQIPDTNINSCDPRDGTLESLIQQQPFGLRGSPRTRDTAAILNATTGPQPRDGHIESRIRQQAFGQARIREIEDVPDPSGCPAWQGDTYSVVPGTRPATFTNNQSPARRRGIQDGSLSQPLLSSRPVRTSMRREQSRAEYVGPLFVQTTGTSGEGYRVASFGSNDRSRRVSSAEDGLAYPEGQDKDSNLMQPPQQNREDVAPDSGFQSAGMHEHLLRHSSRNAGTNRENAASRGTASSDPDYLLIPRREREGSDNLRERPHTYRRLGEGMMDEGGDEDIDDSEMSGGDWVSC